MVIIPQGETHMPSKPIWKTKTFWLHILSNFIAYAGPAAGLLHIDPQAQALVTATGVAGIAIRLLTDRPATVL